MISDTLQEILMRFAMDIVIITLLVRFVYYGYKKDKEFVFTFFLFNVLIFFICFVMRNSEISMGFAFGMFAIFGILRYRTDTIPIKEMTYLFTSIGLALINAVAPLNTEVVIMNVVILVFVYIMERIWFSTKEQYKVVLYEKIDLIRDDKNEEILDDLRKRSRLNVTSFEIKSMNFLNDSAQLKVFYTP